MLELGIKLCGRHLLLVQRVHFGLLKSDFGYVLAPRELVQVADAEGFLFLYLLLR